MSPEYIVEDMTWAEVMSALEFVTKYEEPKVSILFGKKYNGIGKWLYPKADTFRQDTKSMIGALKRGK